MSVERRLGRGLSSLLGSAAAEGGGEEPAQLPVAEIRPNPYQPRQTFDPGGLEELRASIVSHGVLQPVVVRRHGGVWELIAGERRLRAAGLAGLETIPAVVREGVDDEEMLELALVENVQRRDLDALEKARGYRSMMDALGLTHEQVAAKVGLERSSVTNHLRLLELSAPVQEAVSKGLIGMTHARALLGATDPAEQQRLLARIVRDGLSARQTEGLVASAGNEASRKPNTPRAAPAPWARELSDRMREHLGTKVEVRNAGKGVRGQIVIEYYDRESLDRLGDLLAPRASL
ncbi:MAG: ParB/RepB/Spo0J family partition protein [Planctomycetota bacterium]|jgi:ParB family chromosome partitioning protein|nr:ParB/RepB/Spo0J family partition protein [Planctomycetota bacterium]MDP6762689.1 ParB/RepB/Spo0J family partition protein [Planctomycetota bacterium]MDP6988941.1 ParB/RepB/Spo0J family partition protein [Planctomycetota bacterium]